MNVTLPEKEEINKKILTIYIVITIICVLAIVIVIGVQVLGNDVVDNLFGISKLTKRTEQEETELKSNFETIFDNQLDSKENQQVIYTSYEKKEKTDKGCIFSL